MGGFPMTATRSFPRIEAPDENVRVELARRLDQLREILGNTRLGRHWRRVLETAFRAWECDYDHGVVSELARDVLQQRQLNGARWKALAKKADRMVGIASRTYLSEETTAFYHAIQGLAQHFDFASCQDSLEECDEKTATGEQVSR